MRRFLAALIITTAGLVVAVAPAAHAWSNCGTPQAESDCPSTTTTSSTTSSTTSTTKPETVKPVSPTSTIAVTTTTVAPPKAVVLGESGSAPTTPTAPAAGAALPASTTQLPFTGGIPWVGLIAGSVLVVMGLGLVTIGYRRRAS